MLRSSHFCRNPREQKGIRPRPGLCRSLQLGCCGDPWETGLKIIPFHPWITERHLPHCLPMLHQRHPMAELDSSRKTKEFHEPSSINHHQPSTTIKVINRDQSSQPRPRVRPPACVVSARCGSPELRSAAEERPRRSPGLGVVLEVVDRQGTLLKQRQDQQDGVEKW